MIVDLHCHYPMHVLAGDDEHHTLARIRHLRGRRFRDKVRAVLVSLFARVLNAKRWGSGWRVSLDGLEAGGVSAALSVLYVPTAEIDFDEPYGAKPEDGYFDALKRLLEDVEQDLRDIDPEGARHAIVTSAAGLDAAVEGGRVAFLHCVEGGFHLGDTTAKIDERVAWLAGRGVAYVTLAHLFYRQVATNAPALPFLPDRLYDLVFGQRGAPGLTPRGEAAVRAMYRHRVIVDVSHMRENALERTWALLDDLDAEHGASPRAFPVIASHSAVRLKRRGQAYNLSEDTIRRVAARDGAIGLILAQHQMNEGVRRRRTRSVADSLEVIGAHVDAIHGILGTHAHTALGTDLDGFIKPTLSGLDRADELDRLRVGLRERYGDAAEGILHGNALRVLRRVLGSRPANPTPED